MDRTEWLAKRRLGISGTDAAIILGLNPWRNIDDLLLDKLGLGGQFEGNAATRTGVLLESYVASQWSKDNQKILTNGEFTVHPDIPWAIGTTDFLYPGGVLEIKTGAENTWKKGLPVYYKVQLLHYLWITGRQEGVVSALIVPKDRAECPKELDDPDYIYEWVSQRPRRDYPIEPDPLLQEQLIEKAEQFLGRLEKIRAGKG